MVRSERRSGMSRDAIRCSLEACALTSFGPTCTLGPLSISGTTLRRRSVCVISTVDRGKPGRESSRWGIPVVVERGAAGFLRDHS